MAGLPHPSAATTGKVRMVTTGVASKAFETVPFAWDVARSSETICRVNQLAGDLSTLLEKYREHRPREQQNGKHDFENAFQAIDYVIVKLRRKTRHTGFCLAVATTGQGVGIAVGGTAGSFIPGAGNVVGAWAGGVTFSMAGKAGVYLGRLGKKIYKTAKGTQGVGRKNAATALVRATYGHGDPNKLRVNNDINGNQVVATKAVKMIFDALYPFHSIPTVGGIISSRNYDYYFRNGDHVCGPNKNAGHRLVSEENCQKCKLAINDLVDLLKSW